MLRQQLKEMQLALQAMREKSYVKETNDLNQRMSKLKPLTVPKLFMPAQEKCDDSKDDIPEIAALMKRAEKLRSEVNSALTTPKVINLSNRHAVPDAEIMALMLAQRAKQEKLKQEAEQLQLDVARLRAAKKFGGQVKADWTDFPSNQFSKALREGDHYAVVGKIRLPSEKTETVPVLVGFEELRKIHKTVLA